MVIEKIRFGVRFNYEPKCPEVESTRISEELIIDMAPDGTVYGIELLNANEQLMRGDMGKLLVVNEATGQETGIPLSLD
jgi:uncharacterized protein YuzE